MSCRPSAGVQNRYGVVVKDVMLGTKEEKRYWKVITEGSPGHPRFFLNEAEYQFYRENVQEVYAQRVC